MLGEEKTGSWSGLEMMIYQIKYLLPMSVT